MKFKVDAGDFTRVMTTVNSIVPEDRTGVSPYSGHALLSRTSDGYIQIKATNGSSSVTTSVVASDHEGEPRDLVVPMRQLNALMRLIKGEVNFEVDPSGKLVVKSGRSRHRILMMDAGGFPETHLAYKSEDGLTMEVDVFRRMLKLVGIASSKVDQGAYSIRCVRMEFTDGVLSMYATDGNQMTRAKYAVEDHEDLKLATSLSNRDVAPLLSLLSLFPEDVVKICVDGTRIKFFVSETIVNFSTVSGNYPNMEQIFSYPLPLKFTIDPRDLEMSLKRTSVFSDFAGTVELEVGADELMVTCPYGERSVGEGVETVEVTESSVDKLVFRTFAPRFNKFLTQVSVPVMIQTADDDRMPIQLTPISHPDFDFTYVTTKVARRADGER